MCVQIDDLKEHIRILREEKTQLAGLLPPFSDMTGLLVAYSLLTLRVCVCVFGLFVFTKVNSRNKYAPYKKNISILRVHRIG